MQTWPDVVVALARAPERLARVHRWWRRLIRVSVVLALLTYAALLVAVGYALVVAWRGGDVEGWLIFWATAMTPAMSLLVLWQLTIWQASLRERERINALRDAAISGDDRRAPIAAVQPAPLDQGTLPDGSDAIGPIRRPVVIRGSAALLTAIICFTFGGITGVSALVLFFVYVVQRGFGLLVALLVTAAVATPLLWGGVIAARRRWRWTRPVTVTADETGLSWHEPLGPEPERTIPWQEAKASITFHQRDSTTYARTEAYALIGSNGMFMWQLTPHATVEERAAHYALVSAIGARSGLPLRDLTASVEAIRTGRSEPEATQLRGGVPTRLREEAARASRLAPGESRKKRLGCIGVLLLVLPTVLLCGGGITLQRYQPQYFGTFLSHIHTQRPLYQDSLASPNDDWPNVSPASNAHHESYLHSGGAYHLKGTDSSRLMYWLPGETYGDAAVEVTARELGTAQDDGVGLIVRVDASDTNRVTFSVDHTGFWLLSSYHCCQKNPDDDWTALNGGWSAAIHTESRAANTLLIVMHGDTFLCYVNGHFVGSDAVDGVPSTGKVGIYMNTSVTEGVFSNFSVYPLPNDMPLLV